MKGRTGTQCYNGHIFAMSPHPDTTPCALTQLCFRAIQTNEPYYYPCPLHRYVRHNACYKSMLLETVAACAIAAAGVSI